MTNHSWWTLAQLLVLSPSARPPGFASMEGLFVFLHYESDCKARGIRPKVTSLLVAQVSDMHGARMCIVCTY